MNNETAQALEESIRHWRENLISDSPSTKAQDCALCRKFFYQDDKCAGCPVFEKTGQTHCDRTPYGDADDLLRLWKDSCLDKNKEKFRQAAEAEIDFLESLRETKGASLETTQSNNAKPGIEIDPSAKLPKLKKFFIFDIDGVLSDTSARVHLAHARKWDEFHSAAIDDPKIDSIVALLESAAYHHDIIALTGRTEKFRDLTQKWLAKHEIDFYVDEILMRPDDDFSPGGEMKARLLYERFGSKEAALESVIMIIDDEDKVVEHLRNEGFMVLQLNSKGIVRQNENINF